MSDLHYISAVDALTRFRDRSLSPVELMEAVIARAEAVEPTVNAFAHRFYDRAFEEARAAEARYGGRGEPPRPLDGIPLAIKEEEPVAGQPWTQGSLLYADTVADFSSAFAQRMLDAGAIVHARTTAPEFSRGAFTHSLLHGITRNPWNPEYAVGGSSGGSGAALAAGSTTLASGSDIAGSIRIPASFNGVVGFKPPHGRVPQASPYNLDSYCHCGPMARTVTDTALFENVLAGPHPLDHVSLRPKLEIPARLDGVDGLRLAVSVDLGSWKIDPEIRANTLACADALRAEGATVDVVDLVVPRDKVLRALALHYSAYGEGELDAEIARRREDVTAYAASQGRRVARYAEGGSAREGMALEAELYAPVGALLEDYDALLCPTVSTRGLVAGVDYVDHGIEVDGETTESYWEVCLTPVFNVMARCPVLNVPSGFADNGVPTGLQIVGRTYDDVMTFRVGAALFSQRPWLDTPDRRPALDEQRARSTKETT